jgi:hypothetical protein
MARTEIEALVTEKSLTLIAQSGNRDLIDWIADGRLEGDIPLKNVCAKLTPHLSDEVDSVVGLLGISKRRFLECAIIDAVNKAHQIIRDEGVWEALNHEEEQAAK